MTAPRQPNLDLGTPRQGGPGAPEFRLHCGLADLLRRCASPAWRWTHIASGEYRPPPTARRLKAMGVSRGWPDFMFVSDRGRLAFIELKSRTGRLTPEQRDIALHLMRGGAGYLCTSSFDDAVATLAGWGVLRPGIRPQ